MAVSVDHSTPRLDQFQNIEKWTDVKPFADKIVAIKSPSDYFTGRNSITPTLTFPDIPFSFAYVKKSHHMDFEPGALYYLNLLLKREAIHFGTFIDQRSLEDAGPLELRLASTDELVRIRKAVSSSGAVFSTLYCKEAQKEAKAILDAVPTSKL